MNLYTKLHQPRIQVGSVDPTPVSIVNSHKKSFRLSLASWQMLQRLSQQTAVLEFCQDDGRFYFQLRGQRLDLVRPSTMDALNNAGMIRRERATVPSYAISDKGRAALRDRLPRNELLDVDAPVMHNITVVSQPLHD